MKRCVNPVHGIVLDSTVPFQLSTAITNTSRWRALMGRFGSFQTRACLQPFNPAAAG